MNFRELFTKLDELADVQVKSNDPVANKMSQVNKTTMNTAMGQDGPIPSKDIPGTQPQLGPKPVTVAPAVPQGYKQPTPQVVADPKSDVDAMAAALKAVMAQQKMTQPIGLQTPPTSAEKTKIGSEPNTTTGKPGEPLEEATQTPNGIITKGQYNTKRAEWIAAQKKYDALSPAKKLSTINPQTDWDNFESAWKEQSRQIDASLVTWKADIANAKTPEEKRAIIDKAPDWFRPTIVASLTQAQRDEINPPANSAREKDDPNKAKPPAANANPPAEDPNKAKPPAANANPPAEDPNKAKPPAADADAGGKDARNGSDVQSDAATASKTKRQWAPGTLYQGLGSKDKPNEQVRDMQKKLIALGYDLGDGRDDGRFGPDTKRAVMQFQTDNKLKVDGAAGIATLPALDRVYKEKVPPQGDNTNTNLPPAADARPPAADARPPAADARPPAAAPAAAGDGQGPKPNPLGVVPQPGAAVPGPANNNPPAAAPVTTDTKTLTRGMSDVDAARERQAQAAKDAELVRQADIIKKYGSLDPTKVQTRTGNVNKPWYELKTGDIDYDKDGRKIVYTKNPTGGPGQWSAGSWKDHTANPFSKETPGIFFGPSYDSEEGKKFVQAYRDRTINPDEYEVLKKYWEQNPRVTNNATVDASAREVPVDNRNRDVANALDARGRNTATTPESKGWNPALMVDVNGQRVWDPTNISKALKEELHSELTSIAEELINKKI